MKDKRSTTTVCVACGFLLGLTLVGCDTTTGNGGATQEPTASDVTTPSVSPSPEESAAPGGSGTEDGATGAAPEAVPVWVAGVDAMCAQAIANYEEFDRQDPDPVSATVTAGNLVGHVADAAGRTVPADPGAEALVQALVEYARGEAQTATAMDQGSSDDVSAASDVLAAAGARLEQAATEVGAPSCVELAQEL